MKNPMDITRLNEKFRIYIQSSFQESQRNELFDYIWRQYARRISLYISNFFPRSHAVFEDVFQEIMLKIFRNLHTFDPVHSFKAWIYTIARNQCLDTMKKREGRIFSGEPEMDCRGSGTFQPDVVLEKKEMFTAVERILQTMATLDREIAHLRFFEQFRYREISRLLGLNLNTTKSRIRAIKHDLQKGLEKFL